MAVLSKQIKHRLPVIQQFHSGYIPKRIENNILKKYLYTPGSDHELLLAKIRLKLKKVGKTIRPFRYDLNQIPYDYTVEVRNRFKGLDLIDSLMYY